LRYRRLEGRGLAHKTDKTQGHEKGHFGGVNPAVPVHAVLGALTEHQTFQLEQTTIANLTELLQMTQTCATDKKHDLPKC
jgi:hypothetical protein